MKTPSASFLGLLALPLLSLVPGESSAAVIFSTYNGNVSGTASGLDGAGKAVGFTMGSESYTLSSVSIWLTSSSTVTLTSTNIAVEFYTNDGGNTPGTFIAGFASTPGTQVGTTATEVTFAPSTTLTLSAGTSYWVTVKAINTAHIGWASSSPQPSSYSSAGVQLITPSIFGSGAGGGLSGSNPSNWATASGTYNTLTLNAVPEPGTAGLLVAGSLLLAVRRRGLR